MFEPRACPHCGAPLPADAPDGLCPKCLMLLGFESQTGPAQNDPAYRPTVYQPHSLPPSIEELAARFPQLEILEPLGQGGMGVVYKARQKDLDRVVALKILRPDYGNDPAFAERFVREARALARLSHPAIVTVHDFGRVDGFYYFLMEYIDGANLRELERSGRLPPPQALAIVPQICEALQYAHDQGVVHRDIKPENILIDRQGRVKIADFGLAKMVGTAPEATTLTGAWQVMGTPQYMAPEQRQGSHSVDHRADIYSLGVVIYEMLTGDLPVGRFALPSQKVQVDVRLDEVVLRTLEREPERRYQRASEVKSDLETITGLGPAAASSTQRRRPSHEASAAPLPEQGMPRLEAVSDALLLLVSVFLVSGVGVFGWLAFAPGAKLVSQKIAATLTGMASMYLVCAVLMGNAAVGLRRGRRRLPGLVGLVVAGLFLPAVTVLHVILEFQNIPVWPVLIPLWLGMPVCAWGVATLYRPDVRAAFREAAMQPPLPPVRRVRGPAIGLIAYGALTLFLEAMYLLGTLVQWQEEGIEPVLADLKALGPLLLAGMVIGVPVAIVAISAGRRMLRLQSHRWAMVSSVLAMLPWGLTFPLGLPVGLWAVYVLTREEVRRAFQPEGLPPAPPEGSPAET